MTVAEKIYVIVESGISETATLAAQAKAAKVAAENARDVAIVEGPYYSSVGAGEAATSAGEAFAVDNGDGSITFWRNGSPSEEIFTPLTFPVLAETAGAALVGANDGSSGSIFTTIQGFITKLLSSTGSSIVGFVQSGTGAVQRSMQDKLRDHVSVKDFGAVGDGETDDSAAFQAAIDAVGAAGGGELFLPSGHYKISAELDIDQQSVCIRGASRFSTYIVQSNPALKIFNISGNYTAIKSISLGYSATPVAGATAIYNSAAYVICADFAIRSCYIGMHWDGGGAVAGKITEFEILDYENIGILAQSINDLFVSKFIMNAGNDERGVMGGIRLLDKVEAFICSDGDIILGQYPMTMDASAYTIGTRPAYNNFTNVYFDSARNPAQINKCVETEFVGCWFSNGRYGGGAPGALVSSSQSIRFVSCRFFNSGGSGVTVSASAEDITFIGCKADSNSVTVGAGVSHGFQFADGCTQFQMIGCGASNGLFSGEQGYGIFIGSGCDEFSVTGCNVDGNLNGGILDGSAAAAAKSIYANIGYKTSASGQATILSGNTTVVVNHGLDVTPAVSEILVTRGSSNAGSVDLYPSGPSASQFTINTLPAPSGNITVNWSIRSKGA